MKYELIRVAIIGSAVGLLFALLLIGASAVFAAQKYDVVHVSGASAPIDCPPIFEGTLEPVGIADCNVADGTLVVRNSKRGPTKFSVDTTLSYPEYE